MKIEEAAYRFSMFQNPRLSLPQEMIDVCDEAEETLCDIIEKMGEEHPAREDGKLVHFEVMLNGVVGHNGEAACDLIKAAVDNGDALATVLRGTFVKSGIKFSIAKGGSRTGCILGPKGSDIIGSMEEAIRQGYFGTVREFLDNASEVFGPLDKRYNP